MIEYLLLDRAHQAVPRKEQLLAEYNVDVSLYRELLDRLGDEILSKSNFEVVAGEEIEKERLKKMREVFGSLRESHMFEISSEKYEDKSNIFIKIVPENKEFTSIVEETESLRGLFETSFYLNPGKINLKIYESTKLLYQVDQRYRKHNRIPVLVMNNLTEAPSEHSFENYYSELDISNAYQGGDKKIFEERKCLAVPIVFEN